MIWYTLRYGSTVLGDELIVPSSSWKSATVNSAISATAYPRFEVRKKCATAWAFERWIFELMALATAGPQALEVYDSNAGAVVNYGLCTLVSVSRSTATPMAARWSDQVVLTFEAQAAPIFA